MQLSKLNELLESNNTKSDAIVFHDLISIYGFNPFYWTVMYNASKDDFYLLCEWKIYGFGKSKSTEKKEWHLSDFGSLEVKLRELKIVV